MIFFVYLFLFLSRKMPRGYSQFPIGALHKIETEKARDAKESRCIMFSKDWLLLLHQILPLIKLADCARMSRPPPPPSQAPTRQAVPDPRLAPPISSSNISSFARPSRTYATPASTTAPSSSSSRGGPPPAASSSFVASTSRQAARTPPGATPRPQSNVGARLLKKRQSVAYHPSQGQPGGGGGPVPAVPSLPNIPSNYAPNQPPIPGSSARVQPGGPLALGAQLQPAGTNSQQVQQQVQRTQGENQLFATGLDVDQLASEGFKPEDCKFFSPSALCDSTVD